MHKSLKKARPVMSFLKDETNLIGVIVSSICTVPIALLLDTREAALIAVFVSTAASCICFTVTLTETMLYKDIRKSLRNPILATTWLMANNMVFYLVAGPELIATTLIVGSALSVVTVGFGYLFGK